MPRMTTIQIQGKEYEVSDDDIRRVVRTHAPERVVRYYVKVEGRKFPPTQLIRLTTGTHDTFNSANARSALTRLGFVVQV
jgi:hypothetical protein